MKSNLKEKFDKELDKILKDKKTLYDKYGDKCPYCGFKVPEHYQERNKPTSLSTHMGKMHKEKLVNKGMRIKNLVFNTYTPAILEELKMEKKDKEEAVNKELSSGNFSHTDEIIADIDGYNAAVEELDAKITTLQEDKPRKKRGIGRSQEEL